MPKRKTYDDFVREEMGGLIEQLQIPDLYKQSLKNRWLDQMMWADKKAAQCRRWHYRLRLTTIIGGVILPALVGINFQVDKDNPYVRDWFPYIPFALSQIIAVTAAIDEFCRFGDRWRDYRRMSEDLKGEGWQYLQLSGPYEKSRTHTSGYPLFAGRVESIIKNDVQNYISDLLKHQAKQDEEIEKFVESARTVTEDRSLLAKPEPIYPPVDPSPPSTYPDLESYPTAPGSSTAPAYPPETGNAPPIMSNQLDGVATLLSPTMPASAAATAPSSVGVVGTLRTRQDTDFKLSTQPSQSLPATQKMRVTSGSAFGLQAFTNAENQHLRVTFNRGLGAENRNTWFVFAPHIELIGKNGQVINPTPPPTLQPTPSRNGEIRLPVPYFSQRDNMEEAFRTCNTSSCAMVAKFLGAKISGDDAYFQIVIKYGDTTDHNAQTQALAELGIKSTWHTDLNFDALDQSLAAGLPSVIGILHRGPLDAPTGGHMLVVLGRTASGDYIVNDPFGNLLDDYSSTNGGGIVYPRNVLKHRWTPDGNNSGWGRLFYGNSPPVAARSLQTAPSKGISSILSILSQHITADQLIQIAGPDAPADRLRSFTAAVNQTLEKFQINTPLRIAHFLAQVMHESGGFQYLREIWGPTEWQVSYEGREDLGNTEPGDGKRFMGRGLIQLTGRANYTEFSQAMNVDFLSKPELLEQAPYAILAAGWYWNSRKINDPADRDDLEEVTRRINEGLLGLDDRAAYLRKAKSILKC
ncbi:DUF4231 domain-containing protein [Kovacikia minuta CCNUW1]|uniref:DUF4231 domain-containing protein n=1 Tax=Kovacikia minuta TaxID=2931930 RepID=UPI001CCB5CF4|nr:DUF4231 domain-containing protein [Kovacikia minuta]UBF26586.1 DUF4231 domain-containing protein [Kovacikia minuta CCNUW1]